MCERRERHNPEKKKTSASVKKFLKFQRVHLRLQSKYGNKLTTTKKEKEKKKSWEMSSSLSRVNTEVSVSEALFPPLHSSVSFMKISPSSVGSSPSAPSGIKEKRQKHFDSADMVTS